MNNIICRGFDENIRGNLRNDNQNIIPPIVLPKITMPQIHSLQQEHINIDDVPLPTELKLNCPQFSETDYAKGDYECITEENDKSVLKSQLDIMAEFVRKSMKFYWDSYVKCAYGYDELQPVTCGGENPWGGVGMTIVDNLDTLYLFDLKEEFEKAENWVENNLNGINMGTEIPFSDVVHKLLGGLLSTYSLTYKDMFKNKAEDIGNRLIKAVGEAIFPPASVSLKEFTGSSFELITAEDATTCQLELRYLSRLTNEPSYEKFGMRIYSIFSEHTSRGLIGNTIKDQNRLTGDVVYIGFYDYELKTWMLGGEKESVLKNMFKRAKVAIINQMLYHSSDDRCYAGYLSGPRSRRVFHAEMSLRQCHIAALIGLSASTSDNPTVYNNEIKNARSLMYSCYELYMKQSTRLGPKIINFDNDSPEIVDGSNDLEGDIAESLLILYQATNDPIFQKWGWDIYLAIERNAKVEYGYSGLKNVNEAGSYSNKVDSSFGSRTLKYLYLLFSSRNRIDLRNYVFNSGGHPFEL